MPGPVSDSFDPEWGTSSAAEEIGDAVQFMYRRVSEVLSERDPVDIRTLARQQNELTDPIPATLTEWEWRIIRFSLERAADTI